MTYQTIAYALPSDARFPMGTLRATPTALAAMRQCGWSVSDALSQHGTGDFGHPDLDGGDLPFDPYTPHTDEQLCSVLYRDTPQNGRLIICLVTNIERTHTRLMLLEDFH